MWLTNFALSLFLLAPAGEGDLPADITDYVEAVRTEWGVVGLAVAVVKDDAIVYAEGFGETQKGSGTVSITLENGGLVAQRGASKLVAELEHWHFDTFVAKFRDPVAGELTLSFRLAPDGTVEALELDTIEEFERVAPASSKAR